jgi:hypothetical protein
MSRIDYLSNFTVRQLRIYGRKNGVSILQKWGKSELVLAIAKARK